MNPSTRAAPIFYQCNSCAGVYLPVQDDGTLYFHACPPQTANPRDENIVQDLVTLQVTIKAEGGGRTEVPGPPARAATALPPPRWRWTGGELVSECPTVGHHAKR
jgi:hypothetical protein